VQVKTRKSSIFLTYLFVALRQLKALRWNLFPAPFPDFYSIITASTPAKDDWFAIHENRFASITAEIAEVCPKLEAIYWVVRYNHRDRCWKAVVNRHQENERTGGPDDFEVHMDNSKFYYPSFASEDQHPHQTVAINPVPT